MLFFRGIPKGDFWIYFSAAVGAIVSLLSVPVVLSYYRNAPIVSGNIKDVLFLIVVTAPYWLAALNFLVFKKLQHKFQLVLSAILILVLISTSIGSAMRYAKAIGTEREIWDFLSLVYTFALQIGLVIVAFAASLLVKLSSDRD